MAKKLIIKAPHEVRFAFEHVFTPTTPKGSVEPKYSVCILIPKTDTTLVKTINDAINEVSIEAVADTKKVNFTQTLVNKQSEVIEQKKQMALTNPALASSIKLPLNAPLKDGDIDQDREEFKGHYYINCKSKDAPQVVDINGHFLDPKDFYSGCYGHISINFYAYDHVSGSIGVACGLNNIQKTRDGESFTGGSTAASDFGAPQTDFGSPQTDILY